MIYAKYNFELVRGEDRKIPIVPYYRDSATREKTPYALSGCECVMTVCDGLTGKKLVRLSTEDRSILLGNVSDTEFVEALYGEDASAVLLCFSHDLTEKLKCMRAKYDLFIISNDDGEEVRDCILIGEISMVKGCTYE